MTTLNHVNLATSDVPALIHFFEAGFGFHIAVQRGNGNFAVLLNSDGFVLTLMYDKTATANPYPSTFHIGFLVSSADIVHEHHARLHAAGFNPPSPTILQRGGGKTFGFYCAAPGGIFVEISTLAD